MTWHAQLSLAYTRAHQRTALRFTHDGPLRLLRSLYPEGAGICHNVLVHPPGGLVGGDVLEISAHVGEGAHALVTTPGATRFYRSNGQPAAQRTQVVLDAGARLEWLPLETLAYDGCDAHNRLDFALAEGAALIAWDVTAFGLPHAGAPFTRGRLVQHQEWAGRWLERGTMDAQDTLLMDGALGLASHRCLATLLLACGTPLAREEREALLDATRALLDAHPQGHLCGVTAPNDHMLVLRGLAPVVEPLMQLWRQVRGAWRERLWGLSAAAPRIWAM
jgi:urease accessory protein